MGSDEYHRGLVALLRNMEYLLNEDKVEAVLNREGVEFSGDAELEEFMVMAADRFAELPELL